MVVSCSIVDSTKLRQVKRMEEPFGPKDTGPRREKKTSIDYNFQRRVVEKKSVSDTDQALMLTKGKASQRGAVTTD